MKITAEPRSDQWNADDFIAGPRTFTIAGVKPGSAEQKYDIELSEGEGRVWRPPLTMLRLLITAWGSDGKQWPGRRVTLYRDPSIRFGKDVVGGIRISHLSHIDKTLKVPLTTTRGKRSTFTVEPLPHKEPPAPQAVEPAEPDAWDGVQSGPTLEEIAASTDENELREWWSAADEATRTQINARVQELRAQNAGEKS